MSESTRVWAPETLQTIKALLENIGGVDVSVKINSKDATQFDVAFSLPVRHTKMEFTPPIKDPFIPEEPLPLPPNMQQED